MIVHLVIIVLLEQQTLTTDKHVLKDPTLMKLI